MGNRFSVTILSILLSASVHASGWKLEVMSARALGRSYAGAAAGVDDASIVWLNPAAMTALDQPWTVTAGSPVIDLSIKFRDSGSTDLLGQPTTGSKITEGGSVVAVPHVYAVRRMTDRVSAGFGFNTPFGLGTNYGETWSGRYHATETALLVFNLNPSIAWKINPDLSVGFGIDVQYSEATFGEKIDFGTIGAASGLPVQPQQLDGSVLLEGDDWALGFDAGVLWHATAGTRIGATYRSGTTHTIRGLADFTVPSGAEQLTAGGMLFRDTESTTELPMPAAASLAVAHGLNGQWTLFADATWTEWSKFQELRIDFANPAQPSVVLATDWNDVWRVSIGADYVRSERWTFRAGAADEQVPVPDATREPRVPEADHRWFTAGATYTVSPRLALDLFIVHLTTDRAAIAIQDPTAGTLIGDARWNIWNAGMAATLRIGR